jgi:chromosome segregation ATPase
LLKLKDKVIDGLEEVSMEIEYDSYAFEDLERITKEALEKYQRHTMALKQMLKKQEESETTEKVISEQRTQLEEKEEEIKRLKTEIISQAEEKKKVDDELRKILEDLKETREINVNLRTQLEEAKRIEELLKNQVNEKEESCHKMEAEVVDLRRKAEKSNTHVKFMNNSIILDEILDSQRSPNDKSGLGYNKEVAHSEVGTSKKHDVGPSFSKGERKVASQAPAQRKKIFRRSEQGRHQEAILHLKANSEERYLQG